MVRLKFNRHQISLFKQYRCRSKRRVQTLATHTFYVYKFHQIGDMNFAILPKPYENIQMSELYECIIAHM